MSRSTSYIIEFSERAAGILVSEGSFFTFFAADPGFYRFERRAFRSVAQAEKALRALLPSTDRRRQA